MAFNGYLTNQEIGELAKAALNGGLLDVPRQVLLAGIPTAFAAALAHTDNPLDQFTLDLVRMNKVERMAGGEVPVLILLRNAANRLRLLDRQEAEVFDRVLSRAESAGVPPLPDPTQPPEVTGNERIIGTDDTVGTPPAAPGKTTWRIGSWDVTIRAALISGAFVIIAALIALIPYFLGAYSGTPQPGGSPSAGSSSPAPSATTTSSTPAKTSPITRTPAVVFRDDFCTTASGWTIGTTQTGGHYSRCALRIYANGNDVESSEPTNAGTLPQDIAIDVTARRILGSAAGDEFGIACRSGSEGYTFIVQATSVSIYRYSSTTGIIGRQPLAQVPAHIDMNMSNRLRATCATAHGAAHLTFWVNNTKLAEATDASNPLTSGTVGLFAATTPDTSTPAEAEFTNFVVTRLR